MKRRTIFLTLALLLLLAQAAQAMSSASYAIDWMVPLTSGGGGRAASDHYAAHYTVGQSVIGEAHSAGYSASLGFWQPFAQQEQQHTHVWLPITVK